MIYALCLYPSGNSKTKRPEAFGSLFSVNIAMATP